MLELSLGLYILKLKTTPPPRETTKGEEYKSQEVFLFD
jgi:hypothetical protein